MTCVVRWARPVAPEGAPGLVALLDDHERDRLQRFRRDADRARYVAAHALVRLVLGAALGVRAADVAIDRTCRCGQQHGKPRVPGGPGFSLSHAGDRVGVAVGDQEVGLDVEQVRPLTDLAGLAAHACSPAESAPDAGSFFVLWTRKEALLKATGDGLAAPMSAITLGAGGVRAWSGTGAPDGPVWLHDLSPGPGYVGAVAGLGARPPIEEHDAHPLLTTAAAHRPG